MPTTNNEKSGNDKAGREKVVREKTAPLPPSWPDYWQPACNQLMRRDRILKRLIPQQADSMLQPEYQPFASLTRAIVNQQISTTAAKAIWQRLVSASAKRPPTPARIATMSHEQLRELGLSRRKAEYVSGLATWFLEHKRPKNFWQDQSDETIITELCGIRGIGRWTAQMFLIFSLGRPNVLPLDDVGLLRAISLQYFSGEPVSRFEAREVAQAWTPWSTVATWHLWQSLRTQT